MSHIRKQRLTERERFSHYLRTGRILIDEEEAAEPGPSLETKFNPYHDPEIGRFTFAPGGPRSLSNVTTSWGKHGRSDAVRPNRPQTVQGRRIDVPVPPTTPLEPKPVEPQSDGPDIVVTTRRQSDQPRLGSLSSRYETGGRRPGTINNGRGDAGGPSYGSYQLATNTGTLKTFMEGSEFEPWKNEFEGFEPGSQDFDRKWKKVAEREGPAFEAAQHAFIERTHYDPVVEKIKKLSGLDLDGRSKAVWSVSVQHAGASRILDRAVKEADKIEQRNSANYDRGLVNKIYDVRTSYVLSVASKAAAQNRQSLLNAARIRYPQERRDALRMLEE